MKKRYAIGLLIVIVFAGSVFHIIPKRKSPNNDQKYSKIKITTSENKEELLVQLIFDKEYPLSKKLQKIKLFADLGVNINPRPKIELFDDLEEDSRILYGYTLLQEVIFSFPGDSIECLSIVKALVSAGADVNATDSYMFKETPLHIAAEKGCIELTNLLLSVGAGVNIENDYEFTPLHLAAGNGHLDVVKKLIASKADINAQQNYTYTPLHCAVGMKQIGYYNLVQIKEVVKVLIEAGAKVNAKASGDVTPLHYLISLSGVYLDNPIRLEVANLLLSAGADINAQDHAGFTPLHYAVWRKNIDFIQLLQAAGADINIRSIEGKTPVDLAKGDKEIEKAFTK